MQFPRFTLIFIAILAVFTATGGILMTHAEDKAAAVTAKPALTVSTARAQSTRMPRQLAANGNIVAWQEASVGAQANGLVLREVLVNVGDWVKKDQVLARFAPETINADLAQAKASLAEAQANATDASANAERARRLQGTDALSPQQTAQYQTAEQSALARVEAAKAILASQQLRLAQTQVTAPDHGVISARSATVGAVLPAGTELFRMVRQGRLEWRAEITAAELSQIKVGTIASVTAASGTTLKGRVRVIGPTVDPQSRAALVYVDLPPMTTAAKGSAVHEAPSVGAVLPGMFGKGAFELGSSQALTVPQQAVVIRDGFSYAFRVNRDLRVTQLKLQTGRRLGTQVEVLDGIQAEDDLVVQGAGFLNDGDLVKVAPTLAPLANPAASAPAKK